MSLLQDDFDADYDIENVDGVEFGDIFYLNYHNINVFFFVCGLDRHRVRVFELAKRRSKINGESAEYLTYNLNPTTSPFFVLKHNSWTKSEFWLETTTENRIIVPVTGSSRILFKALELGVEYPYIGEMYAIKLDKEQRAHVLEYYWLAPKKIKKQNKNNFNNLA